MANFWEDLGDFVGWGSARRQREFNAEEAQKNRDWQTMMSNTAHQREVQDLQAAGLNPVLSAGGQGASTPGGSSATSAIAQSNMPALIQSTSNMISTIDSIKSRDKSRDSIQSALALIKMLSKI